MGGVLRLAHHPSLRMQRCILFELAKDLWPPKISAGGSGRGVNRLPPGCTISLINELGHGNLGEIRISEKLSPIEVGPPESFQGQVHRLCRPVSQLGQVVPFQNIEDLNEGDAAGRRWRGADDFVSARSE